MTRGQRADFKRRFRQSPLERFLEGFPVDERPAMAQKYRGLGQRLAEGGPP